MTYNIEAHIARRAKRAAQRSKINTPKRVKHGRMNRT